VQTPSPSDPVDKRKRNDDDDNGSRLPKYYKKGFGGSKMRGGGYVELVAQLKRLVTWLQGHGAGISNCAKWFLQKIWSAATLAARAIGRASGWIADVASTGAATTVSVATSVVTSLPPIMKATADATGLTNMGELLLLIIDAGDAAFQDVSSAAFGNQDTATFRFAVNALACVISPINEAVTQYAVAINADINRIMTANMGAFNQKFGGVIPTPPEFTAILSNTSVLKKLYWLFVSLKFAQTIPLFTRVMFTAFIATGNVAIYITPTCYSILNSNIFTAALLMHAGFYQLSDDTKNRMITLYHAADRRIADTVLPKPDDHKAFTTHLYEVLQQADLDHYKAIVSADQELVKINLEIGKIDKKIVDTMVIEAMKSQIDTQKDLLLARKRELDDIINQNINKSILTTSSIASSVFTNAADGQHAGLASKLKAAGAGSDAANGSLPRSGAGAKMDTGLGGNRSTRKRGMNKKGGAKSKCSPKSTQKAGRKQSARKRR
jgi:hypothetical protein